MSFFEELKRRNVFRVGIAYGVATWLLIQVTDTVFPRIGLPDSAVTLVIALLAIGFIPALIIAWAYEMTPEGLKREDEVDRSHSITPKTAKKLDRVIIAGLLLIIVGMGVERAWFAGHESSPMVAEVQNKTVSNIATGSETAEETLKHQESVAVLPFAAMSSGEDDGYFADGLTEEILNSLAALPELLVTARTSSFHFKNNNLPIQEIAATLGVDHVVEGSVRRSGDRVRITAQLIRANDGFHLWSQTYDRTLEDVFAVQEDIAANIAATLDVVLNEDKRRQMRQAGIGNVEAFIAYQKGVEGFSDAHSVDNPVNLLAGANQWFDHALSLVPEIANASLLRTDHYGHIIYDNGINRIPANRADLQAALDEILSSLEQAMRASDHPAQRAMIDAERTLFTNNWSGLAGKIEKAFQTGHCTPANWIASAAMVFGWSAEAVEHGQEMVRCDPVNSNSTWGLAQMAIWNLQPEIALDATERYLQEIGYQSWVDDMRFLALQASGKYRDDPSVYDPNPEGSSYLVPRRLYIHALDGEIEVARKIYEDFKNENPVDDITRLIVEAALGDMSAANALAAEMDARFAGPFILLEATKGCFCGAPFDIDLTPNFKARIEEAGFPWPPATPIKFPAKDW